MSDWQTTRLGDLCTKVTSGGTPLRSVKDYYEGGTIPWLKTGEVKKGYVWETEEHITERGLRDSSAKLIPANSLIVAMYGDGDTAGNVAINKIPLATNQACCNFILNAAIADYRFVYHYLKGSYSNLVGLKLGGSQQNLNATTLKSFPINLPSLAVQQKIAAILSAYDDLIANNQRRIALLERMAEDIYREWFVRLRFPGHEQVKIEKGVPQGWSFDVASRFFTHVKGKSYGGDELTEDSQHMPFITLKSFNRDGGYRAGGLKYYSGRFKPEQVVQPGDVVMAVTDMTQNREVVGRVARVPELGARGAVISLDVIKLVPRTVSASFLYSYLRLSGFGDYIKEFANGTNVLHLKPDVVTQQKLLMPPLELQARFDQVAQPLYRQIDTLNLAITELGAARDALLPRLISGQLAVDGLDIRFPPGMAAG